MFSTLMTSAITVILDVPPNRNRFSNRMSTKFCDGIRSEPSRGCRKTVWVPCGRFAGAQASRVGFSRHPLPVRRHDELVREGIAALQLEHHVAIARQQARRVGQLVRVVAERARRRALRRRRRQVRRRVESLRLRDRDIRRPASLRHPFGQRHQERVIALPPVLGAVEARVKAGIREPHGRAVAGDVRR